MKSPLRPSLIKCIAACYCLVDCRNKSFVLRFNNPSFFCPQELLHCLVGMVMFVVTGSLVVSAYAAAIQADEVTKAGLAMGVRSTGSIFHNTLCLHFSFPLPRSNRQVFFVEEEKGKESEKERWEKLWGEATKMFLFSRVCKAFPRCCVCIKFTLGKVSRSRNVRFIFQGLCLANGFFYALDAFFTFRKWRLQ